ncbi:MAG: hypothetical protein KAT77_03455 [Nanoarchaeota archaeon]|nr:hypothetical protein [Nanoarchaeota archaeon]
METKQKMFLRAESIYKYLMGLSDKLDTLIICKPENTVLMTYDQSIYEALGAIEDRTKIDYNKLIKLLEAVEIQSFREKVGERKILKQERVDELRGEATERDKLAGTTESGSGSPKGELKKSLEDEKNE